MLLEKVRQERQDALGLCITKAWDDACSKLPDGDHSFQLLKAPDGTHPGQSGLDALISALKLIRTSDAVYPLISTLRSGNQTDDLADFRI